MYDNDWTRDLNTATDFTGVREVDLVTRGAGEDYTVLAGSESSTAAQLWATHYNATHSWTDEDAKAVSGQRVPLVLPDGPEFGPLTGEVLHLVVTGVDAETRPVAAAVSAELAQVWADHYNAHYPWTHPDDKAHVLGTIELIPGTPN
ncbi:hypothetical protein ACFYTF_28945 [Nocardia thailandica]|uniref:Uncharacterized protein n=1 Tax=Nocardia thailandica TaxID=257275 RepID=A0ABW6PWS0_9NOCA